MWQSRPARTDEREVEGEGGHARLRQGCPWLGVSSGSRRAIWCCCLSRR